MAEAVRQLGARERECYFWATHQGIRRKPQ